MSDLERERDDWKERAEASEKACAEMREALKTAENFLACADCEVPYDIAKTIHFALTGSATDYISPAQMKEKVRPLVEFLKHTHDSWDCDTGANANHHYMCRSCEAEKLLTHARKEGLL